MNPLTINLFFIIVVSQLSSIIDAFQSGYKATHEDRANNQSKFNTSNICFLLIREDLTVIVSDENLNDAVQQQPLILIKSTKLNDKD